LAGVAGHARRCNNTDITKKDINVCRYKTSHRSVNSA
jgi:hypothetical protein